MRAHKQSNLDCPHAAPAEGLPLEQSRAMWTRPSSLWHSVRESSGSCSLPCQCCRGLRQPGLVLEGVAGLACGGKVWQSGWGLRLAPKAAGGLGSRAKEGTAHCVAPAFPKAGEA